LISDKDTKTFALQQKWLSTQLYKDKVIVPKEYYFYFEHMQKHTIPYGDSIPPVIGLDIRPKEGAFGKTPMFISRDTKVKMFTELGIPTVSLKWQGKVKDFKKLNLEDTAGVNYHQLLGTSAYYQGEPEGIVIKNYGRCNVYGRQMFGKIVRKDFKELNKAVFGGVKKDRSETLKLVEYACTPARVKKAIHSLTIEGGNKLERGLMKHLPMTVVKDIFKEEYEYILKNCKEVDIQTMKQVVAKECLRQLDIAIYEKDNGEKNEI